MSHTNAAVARLFNLRRLALTVSAACLAFTATTAANAAALAAPKNVKVVGSGISATISWTLSPGATAYRIYRTPALGKPGYLQVGAAAVKVVNTALAYGTTYSYYVVPLKGTSAGTRSATVSMTSVPVAPTSVTKIVSAAGVRVSWTGATAATSYNILRGTSLSAMAVIGSTKGLFYNDAAAAAGTTYYYRVQSANLSGGGLLAPAITALTFPAAPAKPTVSLQTGTTFSVNWAAVRSATSYTLWRALDAGAWAVYKTGLTGLSTLDANLGYGHTATYAVVAVNASGSSAQSPRTQWSTPPPAPTGLTGTLNASFNNATIAWTASPGATSYALFRSDGSGGQIRIASPTVPNYQDATVEYGRTYVYQVIAVSNFGSSPRSETISVLMPPAQPSGFVVTANRYKISTSWNAATGAESYRLWRSEGGAAPEIYQRGATSPFVDDNLPGGHTYNYQVQGLNATGYGPLTAIASATTAPPTPTGVGATAQSDSNQIAWTAADGASSYVVYRHEAASTTFTEAGRPTTNSYADLSIEFGKVYVYRVTATNAAGASEPSTEVTLQSAPPVPANFQLSRSGGTATLTWSAALSATSYEIYTPTGSTISVGSALTYVDPTLQPGLTYTYYVRAVNASAPGAWSTSRSVTLPPSAPTGLNASAREDGNIIAWTASPGATTYIVYRHEASVTNFAELIRLSTNTHADASIQLGKRYVYRVVASNAAGSSDPSSEVSIQSAPPVPGNFNLTTSATTATLTWTASLSATSYDIYMPAGTTQSVGAALTYVDSSLQAGRSYTYYVRAVNASSPGPWSASRSVTLAPLPPTGLNATGGRGQNSLSWSASSGATQYKIFRGTAIGSLTQLDTTTATTYTDQTVVGVRQYFYAVTASNAGGESARSATASATSLLVTPTNLHGAIDGNDAVLEWNGSTGASSYKIFRALNGAAKTVLTSVSTTSHRDTTLPSGGTATYTVAAVSASPADESPESASISLLLPPAQPSNFRVAGAYRSIAVSWNAAAGATSYRILRGTSATNLATLTEQTELRFTDAGLRPGTSYWYAVVALNSGGASSPTATLQGVAYGTVSAFLADGILRVKCYDCTSYSQVASHVTAFKAEGPTVAYAVGDLLYALKNPVTGTSNFLSAGVVSFQVSPDRVAFMSDGHLKLVSDPATTATIRDVDNGVTAYYLDANFFIYRWSSSLYRVTDSSYVTLMNNVTGAMVIGHTFFFGVGDNNWYVATPNQATEYRSLYAARAIAALDGKYAYQRDNVVYQGDAYAAAADQYVDSVSGDATLGVTRQGTYYFKYPNYLYLAPAAGGAVQQIDYDVLSVLPGPTLAYFKTNRLYQRMNDGTIRLLATGTIVANQTGSGIIFFMRDGILFRVFNGEPSPIGLQNIVNFAVTTEGDAAGFLDADGYFYRFDSPSTTAAYTWVPQFYPYSIGDGPGCIGYTAAGVESCMP